MRAKQPLVTCMTALIAAIVVASLIIVESAHAQEERNRPRQAVSPGGAGEDKRAQDHERFPPDGVHRQADDRTGYEGGKRKSADDQADARLASADGENVGRQDREKNVETGHERESTGQERQQVRVQKFVGIFWHWRAYLHYDTRFLSRKLQLASVLTENEVGGIPWRGTRRIRPVANESRPCYNLSVLGENPWRVPCC